VLINRQLQPVEEDEVDYSNHGGTYDNLFDAHPPFQIDGNFGVSAGIAEMLLQSHEGYLHLLPALPNAWSKGEISGLVGRGNVIVSLWWQDGLLQKASFTSNISSLVCIQYQDKKVQFSTKVGDMVTLNANLQKI
jgi:alpha-L-fucosidase 2